MTRRDTTRPGRHFLKMRAVIRHQAERGAHRAQPGKTWRARYGQKWRACSWSWNGWQPPLDAGLGAALADIGLDEQIRRTNKAMWPDGSLRPLDGRV